MGGKGLLQWKYKNAHNKVIKKQKAQKMESLNAKFRKQFKVARHKNSQGAKINKK